MSSLRQRLIHDLQLRNRSTGTIRTYVSHVCGLTRYYGQSPEQLDQEQVRAYLIHLLRHCFATRLVELGTDLHTWGQNLMHHPHVHCVVPGGGISPDGTRWVASPPNFFLPVRVLSRVFRGKFLAELRRAWQAGELSFHGSLEHLRHQKQFQRLLNRAYQVEWVVYAKPPFGGPEQVLKYLARYTHRVAISNNRLVSLDDKGVTFQWKDYAQGGKGRTMTLLAVEFLRRFLLHVLPSGFQRLRRYGFLANGHAAAKLELCRRLLQQPTSLAETADLETAHEAVFEEETLRLCPICRAGRLLLVRAMLPRGGIQPLQSALLPLWPGRTLRLRFHSIHSLCPARHHHRRQGSFAHAGKTQRILCIFV